ncbi:hypothetical protein ACFX19_022978 [Malus domestica]
MSYTILTVRNPGALEEDLFGGDHGELSADVIVHDVIKLGWLRSGGYPHQSGKKGSCCWRSGAVVAGGC